MHDFCDEKENAGNGQRIFALLIHSEGDETSLEILSVCQYLLTLASGEKSGNTSDGDTQLRWSPPGIACEPVLPTPAVMRTDGARWARRRQNLLLGLNHGKYLNVLPTPMGHPGAPQGPACHIHPPHRSEHDRLSLNGGRRGQETADRTDSTCPIPFGP
jgi:hypothetical protein